MYFTCSGVCKSLEIFKLFDADIRDGTSATEPFSETICLRHLKRDGLTQLFLDFSFLIVFL